MNLDLYIKENLDEIINNQKEYITNPKDKKIKVKKNVSWKEENIINSKILDTSNEDITTIEDIQDELMEEHRLKKEEKEYLNSIGEYYSDEEKEENITEQKFNLLNLFLMHYNEKFNKCENYFSNIKNIEKDTSTSMELLFEAIIEFKKIGSTLKIENDEIMKYYKDDTDNDGIDKMIKEFPEGQLYCLDYLNKRIISPSILICLNYLIVFKKDLFEKKDWNIFNLRDY